MAKTIDRVRLILELVELIQGHLAPTDRTGFTADIHMRDATGLRLMAIGEAAREIDAATKAAHPGIPWHRIVAMRNFIAHNYEAISAEVLWDTAAQDLPPLAAACHAILTAHGETF